MLHYNHIFSQEIIVNKPLLLTRGIIVFPTVDENIEIGRIKSINSIKAAADGDKKIVVVSQKDPQVEEPSFNDIYQVGTLCHIASLEKNTDDSYKVTIKGDKRVLIKKMYESNGILSADYELLKETNLNSKEIQERIQLLYEMIDKSFANYAKPKETKQLKTLMLGTSTPSKIADQIAAALPVDQNNKQKLLEELDVLKRVDSIIHLSAKEEDAKVIDNEINRKVNSSLSKQQKEFYLREKMRVVKEELGEINSRENDVNAFKKRVEENPYPEHIKKRVLSEISRMESSNPQENSVTRAYIE
jgi:ATP-dependent Lon protease